MHKRKRTRLISYSYRNSGYYFVTVCIETETPLGHIVNAEVELNTAGEIVKECWCNLSNHYKNCKLDYYVIMPDHFHGIIIIDNDDSIVGEGLRPSPTTEHPKTTLPKKHGLPEMVRAFKSFSSRRINELNLFKIKFHWQRSFYDRIISNEKELYLIRKYIRQNPLRLQLDDKQNADIF